MPKAVSVLSYASKASFRVLRGSNLQLKWKHSSREQLSLAWPQDQQHFKAQKPEELPDAVTGYCRNFHFGHSLRFHHSSF